MGPTALSVVLHACRVQNASVADGNIPFFLAFGLSTVKSFLRHQLERYAQRLEELDFLLSREDIMSDMAQYRTISREHAEVTQAAGRYARYQQDLQQALTAPRWLLGRTWGDDSTTLKLEDRFSRAVTDRLRAAGHAVELVAPFTAMMGHAGAIVSGNAGTAESKVNAMRDAGIAVPLHDAAIPLRRTRRRHVARASRR